MPAFLLSVLSLFAKPLGALLNNVLAAGSAAVIAWAVQQGMDHDVAVSVAAGVVGVLSLLIQWGASTQGVNIKVINDDQNNGARVVDATSAKQLGLPKLDPSAPKG